MIADHLTCAIEDIDTQVANMNAAIDAMRDQVDVLVDTRIQLLGLRDRVDGTIPLAASPVPTGTADQLDALAHPQPAPPAPAAAVPRPRKTNTTGSSRSKYDLAEIAQIASEAYAAGRSPVDDLIDHTECPTPQMARYLMTSARAAGHDIPRARGGPKTPIKTPEPPPSTRPVSTPRNQAFQRVDAATVADLEQQAGLT